MPKLKTHKGAQDRIKITGSGKLLRAKVGKSHLRIVKPKRVKRQYRGNLPLSPEDEKQVRRLLPYGIK